MGPPLGGPRTVAEQERAAPVLEPDRRVCRIKLHHERKICPILDEPPTAQLTLDTRVAGISCISRIASIARVTCHEVLPRSTVVASKNVSIRKPCGPQVPEPGLQ